MEWLESETLLTVLCFTWAACGVLQLLIYLCVYLPVSCRSRRQRQHRKPVWPADLPPVSVIVYAHNDCTRLASCLPLLLEQKYPAYEVIVVDNASKDDTEPLLQQLQTRYPHLRVTGMKDDAVFVNTAYFAQTIGVKAAQYDFLLLTDARCRPEGPHWIEAMLREYAPATGFVLGSCQYDTRPGLLNLMARYERFCLTAMGFGLSLLSKPCLSFGGSLSYRRSIFFDNHGFAHIAHIPVGNIPVFVPELARRNATALALHPDAFVREEPPATWTEWRRVRRTRHAAEQVKGSGGLKCCRQTEMLTRLLFYVLSACLLLLGFEWQYVAAGVLLRLMVQMGVLVPLLRRLHVRRLWWWIPLLDLVMQPLMLLALGLSGGWAQGGRTIKYNV